MSSAAAEAVEAVRKMDKRQLSAIKSVSSSSESGTDAHILQSPHHLRTPTKSHGNGDDGKYEMSVEIDGPWDSSVGTLADSPATFAGRIRAPKGSQQKKKPCEVSAVNNDESEFHTPQKSSGVRIHGQAKRPSSAPPKRSAAAYAQTQHQHRTPASERRDPRRAHTDTKAGARPQSANSNNNSRFVNAKRTLQFFNKEGGIEELDRILHKVYRRQRLAQEDNNARWDIETVQALIDKKTTSYVHKDVFNIL
jgi:hypothetical protein